MNFIFVSPQFPHVYWNFCDRLKKKGVNVLGIGDTPYDQLTREMREALTEYYFVPALDDYDQMLRAVGFFTFKYGRIDWLESNNEHWLMNDARLRTDFNIRTGWQSADMEHIKSKSAMKAYYQKAGISTARLVRATTLSAAEDFLDTVGYPVIVKPDVGAGATGVYRIDTHDELRHFFASKPDVTYVIEEFVAGDICSYDAIVDADANPIFESMTVWPPTVMDIVLYQLDLSYYTVPTVPDTVKRMGRAALKAFRVHSRFVHFEFFRLTEAKAGLGAVGDYVGLEVNMRPAGGYTTDMTNFAHSTDVYEIWADMITANRRLLPDCGVHCCCAYAGRRDFHRYAHTHEEILSRYADSIVMCERLPEVMWPQMGNQMYMAKLRDQEKTDAFIRFVQERMK